MGFLLFHKTRRLLLLFEASRRSTWVPKVAEATARHLTGILVLKKSGKITGCEIFGRCSRLGRFFLRIGEAVAQEVAKVEGRVAKVIKVGVEERLLQLRRGRRLLDGRGERGVSCVQLVLLLHLGEAWDALLLLMMRLGEGEALNHVLDVGWCRGVYELSSFHICPT